MIEFTVRITKLEGHAHMQIRARKALAGSIILRKDELLELLYRLGKGRLLTDVLSDTPERIKKQVASMFDYSGEYDW